MFGGEGGPTHMVLAQDCRVETADGKVLLDWTMALGAVALGYAHAAVVEAVARAARDGAVGPLPPKLEVRVAERLAAVYPGAGRFRFFKTGAEAVQAAVRLSRLITGRDTVVHCGYHGWLDGPTVGPGVPAATAAMWHSVPFNDIGALEIAMRTLHPAALVLEPVVERNPSPEWLGAARRAASDTGALLVFDEVKTAFRLAPGGAAQRWGVTPELAVLGKALSNGYALAALGGDPRHMARLQDTWVSSTLATEFVSLAAADAVLDVWERTDVAGHIERIGALILEELSTMQSLAVWPSDRLAVRGVPSMWYLDWSDVDAGRRFLLGCVRRGVLLKRGAYNFPSLAHGEREARETLDVIRDVLSEVSP